MSGLKLLGGISAVIAIIDGSVKVWESAHKDLKFSATFKTVGNRLPILRDILQTYHERFEPIKTSLKLDVATDDGDIYAVSDRAGCGIYPTKRSEIQYTTIH